MRARWFVSIALIVTCSASTAEQTHAHRSIATISVSHFAYFPGSRLRITPEGMAPPYRLSVLGEGSLVGSTLRIPLDTAGNGTATIIAASRLALAMRTVRTTSPPEATQPQLAVATYDDGVVLHSADPPFAPLGVLGIGGAPTDVATDGSGHIAAADTSGDTATIASIGPWNVRTVTGVPLGDEIAIDDATQAVFVTDRDLNGSGALTRIDRSGAIRHTLTGDTSEGLAIDDRRHLVYVANVNDGTISIVDANTMRVRKTFAAVARVFALALSGDRNVLYAVSNQSVGSPFRAAGGVVAFDVSGQVPFAIAHSGPLAFPVGITVDERDRRIFVTDELKAVVYVLDARTLRPRRSPLATCGVPWLPTFDPASGRLYVPCARSNSVDVFSGTSLVRMKGAPFATGGYPLAIALWHPTRSPIR